MQAIWQLVITRKQDRYKISVQDDNTVVETIYCDDLATGLEVFKRHFYFSVSPDQ